MSDVMKKCPECGELCEWVDAFPICQRDECPSNQFEDFDEEEEDEDEDTDEFASDTGDEDEV